MNCLYEFWGKFDKNCHYPLFRHLLDTSAVLCKLWDMTLSQGLKRYLSDAFSIKHGNQGGTAIRNRIAFLAALHDIGKATPDFQGKSPQFKSKLENMGYKFPGNSDCHHGLYSTYIIREFLLNESISASWAKKIAAAIGAHHGRFHTSRDIRIAEIRFVSLECNWKCSVKKIFKALKKNFKIDSLKMSYNWNKENCSFFIVLAGLVSVSDWIASSKEFFPYNSCKNDIKTHFAEAKIKAEKAIEHIRWKAWESNNNREFKDLFSFDANTLQKEIIKISNGLDSASLVIIEAPMGDGKTEAAFYLMNYMNHKLNQNGAYIALPTQATANAMYDRFRDDFLKIIYTSNYNDLKLIHGNAILAKDENEINSLEPERIYDENDNDKHSTSQTVDWFSYKKRGLLAPYGAGTIDQALLSILQSKHFFIRLFGLSNKTVILDEVHAYDTYMTTLLERLIEWLAAVGSNIIILSATLPSEKRKLLIESWQKGTYGNLNNNQNCPNNVEYPRITYLTKTECKANNFSTKQKKIILCKKLPSDLDELAKKIIGSIKEGGCAAFICNTVKKAQDAYCKIKSEIDKQCNTKEDIILKLFHARFPFEDRNKIEKEVIELFGKRGFKTNKRPEKAILVATQVVEQSLDIDFDVMFTELAPIDLILQRSGRLQRHYEIKRPESIGNKPVLYIVTPEDENNLPDFGSSSYVYSEYILYKTWLVVRDLCDIKIPDNIECLVEKVYGNDNNVSNKPEEVNHMNELKQKDDENESKLKNEAKDKYIKSPYFSGELYHLSEAELKEDDPTLHKYFQASTRYSERPSIRIVCLRSNNGFDPTKIPDKKTVIYLINRIMSISNPVLYDYFINIVMVPEAWKNNALLRKLYPAVFDDDGFLINNNNLKFKLDDTLGGVYCNTK